MSAGWHVCGRSPIINFEHRKMGCGAFWNEPFIQSPLQIGSAPTVFTYHIQRVIVKKIQPLTYLVVVGPCD